MITMFKQFINESLKDNPYLPYLDQIKNSNIRQYLQNNDPAAEDNYSIRVASRNGHLEVVKVLLQDSRVDPSARNNYAIRWASMTDHVEVVKVLLQDTRVDPTDDDNLAIIWASRNGHVKVVKVLADYFCGGDCLLSLDEIQQIIEDTEDSEIDYVIARKNQGKIAKQQGFGDDDELLDLF